MITTIQTRRLIDAKNRMIYPKTSTPTTIDSPQIHKHNITTILVIIAAVIQTLTIYRKARTETCY